jgi:hypothetical protein
MKKAIVLEVKRKYAVAMTEDKKIIRLTKKPDMNENQMVYYFIEDFYAGGSTKTSEKIHFFRVGIAFACVLLFLLVSITNLHGPIDRVYAMVTFDVNPSLEVFIDEDEQVKYIEPLNEEAKKLIKGYSAREKKLSQVLEYLTKTSVELGYLTDQGIVLVSYTGLDSQGDTTIPTMDNYINQYQETYTLVYARPTEEEAKEAQDQGLSVGKYILMKQSKSDIDEKDVKTLKISELIESVDKLNPDQSDQETDRIKIYPAEKKLEESEKIDNPNKPEEPGQPDKIDNPNKPEEPGQAEKIDNLNKPEEPGQAEKIDNPNKPEEPGQAEKIDNTNKPEEPGQPDKIDNPNKPEEAGQPDKIDNPNKPVEEEQEEEGDVPTDDGKIDNPNKPEEPGQPEKIDNPNKPEKPVQPDKIDNPNKPVEEEQEEEGDVPTDEGKIDNPNKPEKPDKKP